MIIFWSKHPLNEYNICNLNVDFKQENIEAYYIHIWMSQILEKALFYSREWNGERWWSFIFKFLLEI